MSAHRGLLHHMILVVSNLSESAPFYEALFGYLGYELEGSGPRYQDWKRWDLDTPHEISIVEADESLKEVKCERGAVGHHHHIAFCAADEADVDRIYREVLAPLQERGKCVVDDPPGYCPEYGEGYYATFFRDPDGLRYEFVINPNHLQKKALREASGTGG